MSKFEVSPKAHQAHYSDYLSKTKEAGEVRRALDKEKKRLRKIGELESIFERKSQISYALNFNTVRVSKLNANKRKKKAGLGGSQESLASEVLKMQK